MRWQTRAARRRFLEASAGLAIATWLDPAGWVAASETVLGTLPFVGEGAFPLETTIGTGLGRRRALDLSTLPPETLVVPQDRFFIRTGCPDPVPRAASWKVRVHGLLEKPVELPIDDLRRLAVAQGAHLLECAGNSRAAHFGFMSAATWTGVALLRVLERVRVQPRATQVLVSGFDQHTALDPGSVPGASWIFSLALLRASGAFLATEMNGAALSPDHGFPLRLVVPGWYGCTAVKWVNEIVLVDDEALATDQMREYAGRTHQPPALPHDPLARDFEPATIDPAAVPVRVDRIAEPGGTISYRVVGIFWGGQAPARSLHIRFGPEPGFAPVEKTARSEGRPWSLWSHTFRPRAPGRYRIEMAVKDGGVRTRRLDTGFYAREIEIA